MPETGLGVPGPVEHNFALFTFSLEVVRLMADIGLAGALIPDGINL